MSDTNTKISIAIEASLFDDESVHEKLTVMYKSEVLEDDGRNAQWSEEDVNKLEDFLQLGRKYRITYTVEDIGEASEV